MSVFFSVEAGDLKSKAFKTLGSSWDILTKYPYGCKWDNGAVNSNVAGSRKNVKPALMFCNCRMANSECLENDGKTNCSERLT